MAGKQEEIIPANPETCRIEGEYLTFRDMPDDKLALLMAGTAASGAGLLRIQEQQQTLEDIFLDLTGRKVSL